MSMRPQGPGSTGAAFTLIELLLVTGIVVVLMAVLIPVVGMIRDSARVQLANRTVTQLHLALASYLNEDPQHRLPPAEGDHLIRSAKGAGAPRLMNQLEGMGQTSNMPKLVADLSDETVRVLVDPWGRPYRYQPDVITPGGDPTMQATTVSPDPTLVDWNARGAVPYDYVWSLGKPRQGHADQVLNDPDATAPNPAWIYVHSTASPGP